MEERERAKKSESKQKWYKSNCNCSVLKNFYKASIFLEKKLYSELGKKNISSANLSSGIREENRQIVFARSPACSCLYIKLHDETRTDPL